MLILRLNHAQHAIADGRLDEACEVLSEAAAKQHRKGQELINTLVGRLLDRGREHLAADRLTEALVDCDRAARFAGNQPEIVALRDAVRETEKARAKHGAIREKALATARRHIERGEIDLGQAVVADISDGTTVGELKKQAARTEALIESRIGRVENAIKSEQWNDAVAGLRELKTLCPNNDRFLSLLVLVGNKMVDQATRAIGQGQLVQASDIMDRITGLVRSDDALECRRSIEILRRVARNLNSSDLRSVISDLRHLHISHPVTWIEDAIVAAEKAQESRDVLQTSPLSLLSTTNGDHTHGYSEPIVEASVVEEPSVLDPFGIPESFVLQADGASGYFVTRKSEVTFGPRSTTSNHDIHILGQNAARVTIRREDGDYFLQSDQPIVVNNRRTSSKLLSHGDRIELGSRSSIRFFLPCAASASAVIELTGCKPPQGGCRKMLMFDNALVLAGNAASHVRSSVTSESYVLFVRDGQLLARPLDSEKSSSGTIPVEFERATALGDINVVVSRVNTNPRKTV